VTAGASVSPLRNCESDSVSVWIVCNSVRAAISCAGPAAAIGAARPNASAMQVLTMRIMALSPDIVVAITIAPLARSKHLSRWREADLDSILDRPLRVTGSGQLSFASELGSQPACFERRLAKWTGGSSRPGNVACTG